MGWLNRQERAMKVTLIRYKTKEASTEENERLVKGVFRELEAKSPDGIHYTVLKLGDEGSFVHFVVLENSEQSNPLRDLPAFRAFTADIAARCVDAPQAAEAKIVGNYRVF
jgi:hypothetical protein